MRTPQWKLNLGGHAGVSYVSAELAKRGIPNALLSDGFPDNDLFAGKFGGTLLHYIQVKSCHPDHRGDSFRLNESHEKWVNAEDNEFVIFVYLGSSEKNEGPRYWIATKKEVGQACRALIPYQTPHNKERRFHLPCTKEKCHHCIKKEWENNWKLFADLMPAKPK